MEATLQNSIALVQVLITLAAARELGRLVSRRAGWQFPNSWLARAVDSALGLIPISYTIFLLQLAGWVGRPSSCALLAVLSLFAAAGLRRRWSAGKSLGVTLQGVPWWWAAGLAAYILWMLAQSLLPPLGIDELTYHLAVPKAVLDSSGAAPSPDNVYAYFPQLMEMLYLYALPLGGEMAAKLFHSLFLALTGFALYGYARESLSESAARLAVLAFLSIPTGMYLGGLAYVDLAFTCYAFLSLITLLRVIRGTSPSFALLTGILAGGAWCTKYTGLQWLLLLLLLVLLDSWSRRPRRLPKHLLLIPALAGALVAPYLLRNFWLTGWPLFPFRLGPFPLAPGINWDPERSRLFLQWLSGMGGTTGSALEIITAPVRVFVSGRFGDLSAFDGIAGLVFLLVPFALIRARRTPEINRLLLFSACFLFYWSITTRQVRFLLPLLAVLAFLLAWGLAQNRSRALRGISWILIGWNLFLGVRYQLSFHPQTFWLGQESREQFLQARIQGYPLYHEANRRLSDQEAVYLVNMGNFVYFLDRHWRADFVFEYYRLGQELERIDQAAQLLPFFERQGVTHLMLNERLTLSPTCLPTRESQLLNRFLTDHTRLLVANPLDPGQTLRRIVYR